MSLSGSFGFFDDDLPQQRQDAEQVLESLLINGARKPRFELKQGILGRIGFADEILRLDDLPLTSKYANRLSWMEVLNPLLPAEPVETIFMRELRRDETVVQTLVVTKVDVPEEVHEAYAESFFILKGRCACTIGSQVFEMAPGDYLDIPLHVPHDVKLLTDEVTAVLQYQLIA